MPSVSEMLQASTGSFKPPSRFPAGTYRAVITKYEMLPFHWSKKGTYGLAYVPTFRCIGSVEAEDESPENAEVAAEQRELLEKFGDWTAREFRASYQDRDTKQDMARIDEMNFPLLETDTEGNPTAMLEKHAWRFHVSAIENDGTEGGFCHDVLGMEYPEGAPLETLMEESVEKEFIVRFEYEANKDPSRPPYLTIADVAPAM